MAMPAVKAKLMEDLHAHLGQRVQRLITDHINTCQIADLDNRDTAAVVLSAMLYEVTVAAYAMRMDEDDFIYVCMESYRHMREIIKQKRREKELRQ
jgi:hypothetical protein